MNRTALATLYQTSGTLPFARAKADLGAAAGRLTQALITENAQEAQEARKDLLAVTEKLNRDYAGGLNTTDLNRLAADVVDFAMEHRQR